MARKAVTRSAAPPAVAPAFSENRKRLTAMSKVAERFGRWRPAAEVIRYVEAVPTQFIQYDQRVGVGGHPLGRIMLLHGPSNEGKALAYDELVLTPDGWRQIGTLHKGEFVIGGDGAPTEVLGVFPQGPKSIFEVRTDDGCVVRCCGEHRWTTSTRNEMTKGKFKRGPRPKRERVQVRSDGSVSVKSTADIAGTLDAEHYLPMLSGPVQYRASETYLPVHPYFLGLLLGDGCLSKTTVEVTTADDAIEQWIRRHVERLGGNVRAARYSSSTCMAVLISNDKVTHLRSKLRSIGVDGCRSWEKFIPDGYKRASVVNRVSILRGLFDTDGTPARAGVEYCTVSRQLAEDVAEIVRSLGGKTTIRLKKTKRRDAYVMVANLPTEICPFNLERKVALYKRKARQMRRRIVSVTPAGVEICTCIKVAAEDGLFVTRGMVLTHNSEFALGLGTSFLARDHFFGFVDAERTTPMPWVQGIMKGLEKHPGFVGLPANTYEEVIVEVRRFCETIAAARLKGEIAPDTTGLLVVDSIRKLVPKKMLEDMMKELGGADAKPSRPGMKGKKKTESKLGSRAEQIKAAINARWMDELVPLLADTRTTMVIIAREYANSEAGLYDKDWVVGGGRALYYDASIDVRVERSWVYEGAEGEKRVVGERRRLNIHKTKVSGKVEKVPAAYYHTSNGVLVPEGFDAPRDLLEVATDGGLVQVTGNGWFTWGKVRLGQGAGNVVKRLHREPELLAKFSGDVREFVSGSVPTAASSEA